MEAFLVSTMVVGLAEIGDKTQILSLMLAARFQRPLPIIFGIFFATLANHAAAGLAGSYFGDVLNGPWLRRILGISFLSVAVWALYPDKYEGNDKAIGRSGAFMSTLVAFFLAEIGDKTQIATIRLAARFEQFYPVVLGTILGMMLVNIPAVITGDRIAEYYWGQDSREASYQSHPYRRRGRVCHPWCRDPRWRRCVRLLRSPAQVRLEPRAG